MAEIPDFSEAAADNARALFDAHWKIAMEQADLRVLEPIKVRLGQMYVEGYKRGVQDTVAAFAALKDAPE